MCGNTQVPIATLSEAVMNQVTVRPASGARPGKSPMPGCASSTRSNTSSSELAPTLSATVKPSATTSTSISTSLTLAAIAAERRPAKNTNAIIIAAANATASSGAGPSGSVSRSTRVSAVIWICTYISSAAIPAIATATPSALEP